MDEHSQEEHTEQRTGLNSFMQKLYRPGPLILLFSIAFVGLVSLGYFLLTKETPPPQVITEVPPPAPVTPKVYEEDTSSEMEDMVKQADLAIIETIRAMNLPMSGLDLLDVELRNLDGRGYHYQVLKLPEVADKNTFFKYLQSHLAKRLPEAALTANSTDTITVSINEQPTHNLLIKTIPLTLSRPPAKGPKLAVVIDDVGENMHVLKGLINLDFPVTLAVWPNASNTRASVELIVQKRRDLIIHFPMEPQGYPRYNPGDDALFVSMTDEELKKQIAENVRKIPEAIGINNHMGSRFTGDARGMQLALVEFKRHGLFFLDSVTTSRSAARDAARHAGIPFYERDIFIDNVKDVNAIFLQLKKAENVALKQGYAIAIGHPYPETLAALKAWGSKRNTTIQLLPLSKLSTEKL